MARRLRITPELWVDFLKQDAPATVQIVRNALPADARCVAMEVEPVPGTRGNVVLWIESRAFREGDPTDLEAPHMRAFDRR